MATTTPNFGWPVPTSSDLVKNGATAIEGLGDAIDASLLDLKGGTSGQVLKKNSNTDMDFVWGADSAGMTNPMTTTGDTIYSSSGSTPARLGIGTTGQVLTVASGLPSWATPASGGGMTLINTGGTALSGSSVTISSIPSTYQNLQLVLVNPQPTTNTEYVLCQINGATSGYGQYDGIVSNQSFGGSFVLLTGSLNSSTAQGLSITNFYNYANTTTWKMAEVNAFNNDNTTSSNFGSLVRTGVFNSTSAISSLKFYCGAGNLGGGTAYLYGVK